MKTTLVTVSGMSPAIITETLWALAGESPPVVPDEVIVITTSRGEEDIARDLIRPRDDWGDRSVWETLRADILGRSGLPQKSRKMQLSVRVIDVPDEATGIRKKAPDLRTRSDNDSAADFIVQVLAPLCDAEDNHVVASIAGGRKTMGALLYASMSLIGKESDRVTHVLVSEPFETVRGFFYSGQPVQALAARPFGQPEVPVQASDAVVEMADIPFVPLRNGFAEMNEGRRTFSGLVSRYSRDLRRLPVGRPRVRIELTTGRLLVEGKPIALSGRTLLLAAFLVDRAGNGLPHFDNAAAAEADFAGYFRRQKSALWNQPKLSRYFDAQSATSDDITKALSDLRKRLEKAGAAHCIPFLAPERDRIGFDITPASE